MKSPLYQFLVVNVELSFSDKSLQVIILFPLIRSLHKRSFVRMSFLFPLFILTHTALALTTRPLVETESGTADNHGLAVKRDVCRHIQVVSGDSCATLADRCGISGSDFTKYNTKPNLCATLMPDDYVCCSPGDPYVPPKPQPNEDGTCASHIIQKGDDCTSIAKTYHVTVKDLEDWNRGKTWAWTECKALLLGYNMCISNGTASMPPSQEGTECGPLVPGTKRPTDISVSLADLNPCPLNACCSNWGYCGVFPGHCEIHAPPGGGPESKLDGFQTTCVSNCGNEIKKNSGAPSEYQRVGYYESFGLQRECLWLDAKDANTDGSYTHIHWAFASIESDTWKPIVNDTKKQWTDFKALKDVKRILSFGGWAYSTEPGTYNIIRSAIIQNSDTFADNLAQFVKNEGIDGIDIDWEYPGVRPDLYFISLIAMIISYTDQCKAPDILVDGKLIGQRGDGQAYLSFLKTLKTKLGQEKSVSIAAPASFWYLKAFPIDKISEVIDYIVYMTYDLHGQWDYGNVNAFDSCDSGKCICSHG